MPGLSRILPVVAVVVGLSAVVLLAGCQASQSSMATTQAAVASQGDQAVMCDKCKTVWVMRSSINYKGMVSYRRKPVMKCPDCDSAAANFFKTGKLQHTCKACGGTLEACEGQHAR
jgi:rRNA maturation endonuclease Nob1